MSKGFKVTSVCRDDIIQMIDDKMGDGDELKKLMPTRRVEKITDSEMRWIASCLSDDFCNCCFWDNLEYNFKRLISDKDGK